MPHGQRGICAFAALAAEQPNVAMLDLQLLLEDAGRAAPLISDTYWYLGRIRFSKLGFELLGRARAFADGNAQPLPEGARARSRQHAVGGVIGDDGIGGIALGEDGVGKCYRDFQHHVRDLRNNGVLLAVVSKNDPEPVDEALTKHPMMVLRPEDFVRVVADWGNKADHIRALADDLSLALDTFVLLDDNPFERSLVGSELPDVSHPSSRRGPNSSPTGSSPKSSPASSHVCVSSTRIGPRPRNITRVRSASAPRKRTSTHSYPRHCASRSGSTTSTRRLA